MATPKKQPSTRRHNPCFNGQCFAMEEVIDEELRGADVAILVLVDSVLQYEQCESESNRTEWVTILVLVDSVLQYFKRYILKIF